jgi:guanyl-specific ribonuclease Sa
MSNVVAPKQVKAILTLVVAVLGVFGVSTATFAATSATDTTASSLAQPCGDTSGFDVVKLGDLPPEASDTEDLIASNGPYPFPEDGDVFDNREGVLPDCESGYYHEYTVTTPGNSDRGARRIVTGTGGEHFYTDDHYKSFVLIDRADVPTECGDLADIDGVSLSSLPGEVADTVELAGAGGPFAFPGDGRAYPNREGNLPTCAAGYYHRYVVPEPGGTDAHDKRVITGGSGEILYTDDHYATFVLVDPNS